MHIKNMITKILFFTLTMASVCHAAQTTPSEQIQMEQESKDQKLLWLCRYTGEDDDVVDELKKIIALGANLNVIDNEKGRTPLIWAASHNHLKKAKLLLASSTDSNTLSADPNMISTNGETALFFAVNNDSLPMVKMLLQAGADPNIAVGSNAIVDGTPLTIAVDNVYPAIVELLLAHGALPDQKTRSGQTPLLIAARNGTPLTMEALIAAGADVNATDQYGITPLMWAIINEHIMAMQILLQHGADLKKINYYGHAALDLIRMKKQNIKLINTFKKLGLIVNSNP